MMVETLDHLVYTEEALDRIINRITPEEARILFHSNLIEDEYSDEALMDSFIAWNYAKLNRFRHIAPDYVKNIHFLLMRRINRDIGGYYREVEVMVGNRKDTYFPEEIKSAMGEWCLEFNNLKDSEEEIKEEHIKFLKIYPFEDGNGRTARILMNIQRLNSGYGLHLIMKSDNPIGSNYMEWFN